MTDGAPCSREKQRELIASRLAEVGFRVESVFDLVNSKTPYAAAVPVLIDLLPQISDCRLKEGVARALAVEDARPAAAGPLLRQFVHLKPSSKAEEHLKWAIGFAISRTADESVFDEVVAQLRSPDNGWTRSELVGALERMPARRTECIEVLLQISNERDLQMRALEALSKLGALGAVPLARRLEHNPDSWVRGEARKALKRLKQEPTPLQ